MRILSLALGLLALTPLAAAWSKEDREIFRVRDEVLVSEGSDITFYDVLGIPNNAAIDDITKAYRKLTRSLHPDKVRQQLVAERTKRNKGAEKDPSVIVSKPPSESEIRTAQKVASDRQARLSLLVNILRGPERDRYDHFLANGFPTWKGTNYYYNRYRPGLGSVLIGLALVGGGGIHYLAKYLSWRRHFEFVQRYIEYARQTAWGENIGSPVTPQPAADSDNDNGEEVSQPRNRRERRMQQKENKKDSGKKPTRRQKAAAAAAAAADDDYVQSGPQGAVKRVVAENGKILLVDSVGDVYLEEPDEDGNVQAFLLDPNALPKPTIRDTAVVRLPVWIFSQTIGRIIPTGNKTASTTTETEAEAEPAPPALDVAATTTGPEEDDSEPTQHTPTSDSAADDYEMLDKSVDSLGKARTTGAQGGGSGNNGGSKKRRGKKK